jgi:6-phosphogluconolactonase
MPKHEYLLNGQRLVTASDVNEMGRVAAQRFIQLAHAAIRERGAFHLALSGGSTPVYLHQTLTLAEYQQQVEWDKVQFYFGDERNVAPDHQDSNFRMAQETLLSKLPVSSEQVHAMPTGCEPMQDCAQRYAQLLASMPQQQGVPCFDLILLGMGNDGHTASLFPATTILTEREHWVDAVYVEKLSSWRLSLTYPVLEQARAIMILVSGAAKSEILYEVFFHPERQYPIQQVHNPHIEWYTEAATATRLIENDVGLGG